MHISILGANGFLGRKLTQRLIALGGIGDQTVESLTLFDLVAPAKPDAPFPVRSVAGNLPELPEAAIPPGTDVVFHLAAVVSAAAEADYGLGRRVNVRGTDAIIDACHRLATPPRLVFTSSVASFSGGQDAVLGDDARQIPSNTYGAQKAAAELFLMDATRRGYLDAVLIRLPTVIVRPGRPNKAASSFVSAILREPLLGLPAELPVPDAFALWVCSPRRAVEWLMHAAVMDTGRMGLDRSINPPGLRATIQQMLAALDAVKPGASHLIRRAPDPAVAAIVGGWPAAFETARALDLGFSPHEDLQSVLQAFIAEDLQETRREREDAPRERG